MRHLLFFLFLSLGLWSQTAIIWDRFRVTENQTFNANTTNSFTYGNIFTFRNIMFVNDGDAPLKIYVNNLNYLFVVYAGETFIWDRTPFSNFQIVNETTTNVAARCVVSGRYWRSDDY